MTHVRGLGGFPAPACDITEGAPLWQWRHVAHWLWQNDKIKVEGLRDVQEAVIIDNVLDLQHQRRAEPALTAEVVRKVGKA